MARMSLLLSFFAGVWEGASEKDRVEPEIRQAFFDDARDEGALHALQTKASVKERHNITDSSCLCVFDVDRTLTGKQGGKCPGKTVPGIIDTAYGGGTLRLSPLATQGINATFCGSCYLGVCSHGDVGGEGSPERAYIASKIIISDLQQALGPGALVWSTGEYVHSPLVAGYPEGQKQLAVEAMLDWYSLQGVQIARGDVFFFDDKAENVVPFLGSGMNACQVSCASRAEPLGLCGATASEVTRRTGVHGCA